MPWNLFIEVYFNVESLPNPCQITSNKTNASNKLNKYLFFVAKRILITIPVVPVTYKGLCYVLVIRRKCKMF